MINTANDFQSALTFLEMETDSYPDAPGDNMSAYDYNQSMQAIETHLNALYEKICTLEDVNAYCRTFLIKEIQEKEEAYRKKLTIIEETSDQYRDRSYIAYTVPIQQSADTIRDRDGSVIERMDIVDGRLEQHAIQSNTLAIASIDHTSDALLYENTYKNLIGGHSGRSYYLSAMPIYNGVSEEVTVNFTGTVPCNIVNLSLSNCTASDIRLINEENGEEPLDDTNETFATKNVKGLKFTLHCDKYEYVMVPETNKDTVDAGLPGTGKEAIAQAEQATYDQEKDTFLRDYAAWKKTREATEAKNVVVEEVKA